MMQAKVAIRISVTRTFFYRCTHDPPMVPMCTHFLSDMIWCTHFFACPCMKKVCTPKCINQGRVMTPPSNMSVCSCQQHECMFEGVGCHPWVGVMTPPLINALWCTHFLTPQQHTKVHREGEKYVYTK
jgi:hypothetical protein